MNSPSIGTLFILVARPPKVITMKSDGSDLKDLLADARDTPDGIAVDSRKGFVYWTNMGSNFAENDGYIQRMRLDGTGIETLIKPGQTYTPKQLVLDLPSGKMYWSDREGMRVMRADLDGKNVEVLVSTGSSDADRLDETRHCVGIAVDTKSQHLYWTQKGPSNGGKGGSSEQVSKFRKARTPLGAPMWNFSLIIYRNRLILSSIAHAITCTGRIAVILPRATHSTGRRLVLANLGLMKY